MKSLTVKSFAKLNLYLEVLNKRPDGYHAVNTLFERISLFDTLTLKPRFSDNKITLATDSVLLARNIKENLCIKAAKYLQKTCSVRQGVDIRLIKRIPVGAGLGGGSSNAAAVILGLNQIWRLRLTQRQLIEHSKGLGSDVAFFVHGIPFAYGSGRGEIIKPAKELENIRLLHLLVVPKVHVSTPRIYAAWDRYSRLTRPEYGVNILSLALRRKDYSLASQALFNSLEEITARIYPEVRRIRSVLVSEGVKTMLMSGSGPAVFGMVSSRKEALKLSVHLRRASRFWQVFVVRTI